MRSAVAFASFAVLVLAGCATSQGPVETAPEPAPVAAAAPLVTGSIYQSGNDMRLFEDRSARRVGDVLTVMLVERTNAQKSAQTEVDKSGSVSIPAPTIFGWTPTNNGDPMDTSIEADRNFGGSGVSDQSNRLTGEITVVVTEVRPNGNLIISGEKMITLNQGDEFVRLTGEVRPDDIAFTNTVLSNRVANAEIAYEGKGAIASANAVGWLARFFVSAIFPF